MGWVWRVQIPSEEVLLLGALGYTTFNSLTVPGRFHQDAGLAAGDAFRVGDAARRGAGVPVPRDGVLGRNGAIAARWF